MIRVQYSIFLYYMQICLLIFRAFCREMEVKIAAFLDKCLQFVHMC